MKINYDEKIFPAVKSEFLYLKPCLKNFFEIMSSPNKVINLKLEKNYKPFPKGDVKRFEVLLDIIY